MYEQEGRLLAKLHYVHDVMQSIARIVYTRKQCLFE